MQHLDNDDLTDVKKIGNYIILMKKFLGSGQYGLVFLAYKILKQDSGLVDTEKPLACKIIEREELTERAKTMINNEIINLEKVKNPNLLKLEQVFKTHSRYYIFTEACNGGDLEQFVRAKGGQLSELEARLIMAQIVNGLRHLHSNHIMHRDIKLSNILIEFKSFPKDMLTYGKDLITMRTRQKFEVLSRFDLSKIEFTVKIADFGFSKFIGSSSLTDTICGTPLYMSPQLVDEKGYSLKADIWSMGVIYYEMISGQRPFNGRNLEQIGSKMSKGDFALQLKFKPSLDLLIILQSCLLFKESERTSAEELWVNPYFTMSHVPAPIPEEVKTQKKKFLFGIKKSKSQGQKLDTLQNFYSYNFSCKSIDNLNNLLAKRENGQLQDIQQQFKQENQKSFKSFFSRTRNTNGKDLKNMRKQKNANLTAILENAEPIVYLNTIDVIQDDSSFIERSQFIIARDQGFCDSIKPQSLMEQYFSFTQSNLQI
ncbi:protein kinase domain containing protein [Stylonychia lemnae]|uniref:Protein kinase domain containing protein n=1 Tax=Stylonychia lemnae TaxID=5949 RepID=A0A077ZYW7_STYLE|nr:protein kinase domain containing protein [Stylonychia lemnae]|eukprot:CDW74807.1 protein kinase domain containing protein [Stylonychia lemnae]